MRLFEVLLALLGFVMFGAAPVSAQTSATGEVQVHGVIAPARYIVLDNEGSIKQIFSNTSEDVEPVVYQSSINPLNQRNLTSSIREDYKRLLPQHAGPGILYQQVAIKPSAPKPNFMRIISLIIPQTSFRWNSVQALALYK